MKLHHIILSSITATTACFPCPNHQEKIVIDDEITSSELLQHINNLEMAIDEEITLEDVLCEGLCVEVSVGSGWFYDADLDSCTYTLDIDAIPQEISDDSVGTIQCSGIIYECIGGRRPLGHSECMQPNEGLGGYFARCAHLEASSVLAFIQLTRQLQKFQAPKILISRCIDAAKDEVLHARLLSNIARAYGVEPPPVMSPDNEYDLFSIAMHNAVEGCVVESWAALVAQWQSQHMPSSQVRLIYQRIATDEIRHGQLSWDLHDWLMTRLSVKEQNIIHQAQSKAIEALIANVEIQTKHPSALGLPSSLMASQLVQSFGKQLIA